MEDVKVETDSQWEEFAERVGAMAREEGLLGIIVAGFTPAGEGAMQIHLSVMNSTSLCEHDKLGMRLKTIEKLALTTFERVQDSVHDDNEKTAQVLQ